MRRSLLLFIGIVAITYLEFFYYPGHTYLSGASQPLVAMMERLKAPGFLSRDFVAVNPNLTYTIYDEVTLFLCRFTGHGFEWALAAQQLVFRFAGVLGIVLLSLTSGLKPLSALFIAALLNGGVQLPGVNIVLADPEPVPFAFAVGLTILAFGLLSHMKPLLAGLVAGIALAYQPSIAACFWLFVLGAFIVRPDLRPVLRPTFPALLVFGLLLANAAQLQSGQGEALPIFLTISTSWLRLLLFRAPELWPPAWSLWSILFYVLLGVLGYFSLQRISSSLPALTRAIFLAMVSFGPAGLALAYSNAVTLRSALLCEAQLPRSLTLCFVGVVIICYAAAWRAWEQKSRFSQIALGTVPLLLMVLCLKPPPASHSSSSERSSIQTIASWAEMNTWGGSMFLFPDADRSAVPGEFRGRATRAIYVDWVGGSLLHVFPVFGIEWDRRWKEAGGPNYSCFRLEKLLDLPVEYVVLQRIHALQTVPPEITTPDFVVYDAHKLRSAARPLRQMNGS